jgi:hypothetical protein
VKQEGGPDGKVPIPEGIREDVMNSAEHCDKRKISPSFCGHIVDYLNQTGFSPEIEGSHHCLVFDEGKFGDGTISSNSEMSIANFCGVRMAFVMLLISFLYSW